MGAITSQMGVGGGGGGPSKSRGSGTKWKTGQRRDMKIRTKCVIDYKVTS